MKKILFSNEEVDYAKYGYKTLVIWEHELQEKNKVSAKIWEFLKYGS